MQAFLLMLLSLAPTHAQDDAKKIEVVTTLSFLADLAREVGGDHVHVEALADPRQDPHYVEPKPTLMQKARAADLFVEVGLQLELWGEKVASGSGNPRIQSGQPGRVIASAGIPTLELPAVLSREWGDVHPYGNPHVWLDPLNARTMAENLCNALVRVDGAHAEEYRQNLARFQQRIDEALFGADLVKEVGGRQLARLARQGRLFDYLTKEGLGERLGGWLKTAEPLRGRPIVTYHKTTAYLADRFGFHVPVEIEEKPGIPPSARHRDQVVDVMKEQQVKTILLELFYERSAADYLAGKTGANVVALPIDTGEAVDAKDYFALIDRILSALVRSETAPR
jgi:ABC-type Zn uptake system ZnuABC Zn-binding protein ZnuA